MTFQWVHFMTSFMCTNMFPDIDIKIYHLIAMRIMRRFGSEFFFIPLGDNFSKSIEFSDKNMHLAHKRKLSYSLWLEFCRWRFSDYF